MFLLFITFLLGMSVWRGGRQIHICREQNYKKKYCSELLSYNSSKFVLYIFNKHQYSHVFIDYTLGHI